MRNIYVFVLALLLIPGIVGCASRDTKHIALAKASLQAPENYSQRKFIQEIAPGENHVFIRKQNARCSPGRHTREEYIRMAIELPNGHEKLERIDVNGSGVVFRYTEGEFDGPWEYNDKQEGYIYVHRETKDTVELCLDMRVWLRKAETVAKSGDQLLDEPLRKIKIKRFFTFQKNNLDAYISRNSHSH